MAKSSENVFVAELKFSEFVHHFRKMSREEISADIEQSMDDVENLEMDGPSFGALLVRKAVDAKEKRRACTAEYGRMGGRPRKNPDSEDSSVVAEKAPNQLIYGKFANVFLSQDEFNSLAVEIGNLNELNKLIDDFSASLADGSIHSGNHFATISRWHSYRKEQDAKAANAPRRMSVEENNAYALARARQKIAERVANGEIQ